MYTLLSCRNSFILETGLLYKLVSSNSRTYKFKYKRIFQSWHSSIKTKPRKGLYGQDVLVTHFTGNVTEGLDFKWAKHVIAVQPDSRIVSHPIKIAAVNWADATGTLQGNITMISLAHWENGKIAEEYLFWQVPAQ